MTTRQAPPVVYPLGRSCFLGWLLLVLWLAGLFVVLLSFYVTRRIDGWMVLALAAALGAGLAARTSWNNAATGQLAWDGKVWRWESVSYQTGIAEYELSVIADFQQMMLLRLQNQAHARLWLWVERKALAERWLDLRRAVYSPRNSPAVSRDHGLLQEEPALTVAVSDSMNPVDLPRITP